MDRRAVVLAATDFLPANDSLLRVDADICIITHSGEQVVRCYDNGQKDTLHFAHRISVGSTFADFCLGMRGGFGAAHFTLIRLVLLHVAAQLELQNFLPSDLRKYGNS